MRGREIVLALLIIAAGVFVYYSETGRLDVGDGHVGIFLGRSEEFVFEETREFAGPLPGEIEVANAHGSVDIEGADTDRIVVTFKKIIFRKNEAEARRVSQRIAMLVNREDRRLILSTNRDDFRRKNFDTDFRISVPKGTSVLIKNSFGPVRAVRTGRTDIANSHGGVETSETDGPVVVESSFEDIRVSGVGADCRIVSRHADVDVSRVRGELILDHSFGDIALEGIEKKVTVNGSHSAITGKNLGGEVEVATSYEPILLIGAGPTKIRNHHGGVEATGIVGPLEIADSHARLRLTDVRGNLRVDGADLEISAETILADEIRITSSYDNVWIAAFRGKTIVSLAHGDLSLEPGPGAGPIDVQASYANIRLVWPEGEKFPFEAKAKSGSIFWGLPDAPTLEEKNHESVTRAFPNETAKPPIRLSTTYGDIRVESKSGRQAPV